jgi:hypothetical protein
MLSLAAAAGLSGIGNTLVQDWIGPVFLVAVAGFAIMFLRDRAWMKLFGFVAIAAIVGVLIYDGSALFGSSSGNSGSIGGSVGAIGNSLAKQGKGITK